MQAGRRIIRMQVKRVFRAKQQRGAIEFGCVRELHWIFVEVIDAFLDQEDEHGIADENLVSVPDLLLLDRHAVDQSAVAALQIADGKLSAAVLDQNTVAARQRRIGNPKLVRRVTPNGYFPRRQGER